MNKHLSEKNASGSDSKETPHTFPHLDCRNYNPKNEINTSHSDNISRSNALDGTCGINRDFAEHAHSQKFRGCIFLEDGILFDTGLPQQAR